VYGSAGGNAADETAEKIVTEIKKLDSQIISWRDETSELAAVNASDDKKLEISETLFSVLNESLRICADSNGALDITLRPLLDCWNIENATEDNFSIPTENEIRDSLSKTGYEKVTLNEDGAGGILNKADEIVLDLGATGKGYALDVARDYLENQNISGAIVTVGGSVLVYGEKSTGESWKVGVRNPDGAADDMIGYIELSGVDYMCVSTSGDYEKYVEYNGEKYHHILDRSTGYPAKSGLSSVTVMCKSGTDSDGLSTACFVLGKEKSIELLKKYDAEAVFVDTDGNVSMTDGMKEYYREN
jgi:thiamine biosynthesis lipoprotein